MKKLFNFMLIIGIFALNTSLIMGMGPKTELETTIFEQIDAAKKDGDIGDLNTNLIALLATENNDALIDVLKKMKDTLFKSKWVITKLFRGNKANIQQLENLKNFFYQLIFYAKNNFSPEQLYQTIKTFKEIIKNIGDPKQTEQIQRKINNIDINNYEFYKVAINELVKPAELANKDFSKDENGKIKYTREIEDISEELQELLINSAGYSKEEAQQILKYTLENGELIAEISDSDKEAYFDFLKSLFITLGDKNNLDSFAQEAADVNEQFRQTTWFGLSKREYIPAYSKVFLKFGGTKVPPTTPAAPEEADLGTALTKLSVELTSLNAQL